MTAREAAARLTILAQRDGVVLTKDDKMALQMAAQILGHQTADRDFAVCNIISHRTQRGMVEVNWLGQATQIEPVKAREMAWMLVEVASAAETEAQLVRFLTGHVEMPLAQALGMLQEFRKVKEQEGDPGSLLKAPRDTH